MTAGKRGGNRLPPSLETEKDVRNYILKHPEALASNQQLRFAAQWLNDLDAFDKLIGRSLGFYFRPPPELYKWCALSKSRYDTLPKWKREALVRIGFDEYAQLIPTQEKKLNHPKSDVEARLSIGEKSISDSLGVADKQRLNWLQKLEEFIDHWNFSGGNPKAFPQSMKWWLQNSRTRYINNELPEWKARALQEAGFDKYCTKTGWRIEKFTRLLKRYFEKHQTYVTQPTYGYIELHAWRSRFALSCSTKEREYFIKAMPEMSEKQLAAFFNVKAKNSYEEDFEEDKEASEERRDYLIQQHSILEERFDGQNAVQANNILRRLSRLSPLSNIQQEALTWLAQFCRLVEEINSQGKPIVDLLLTDADRVFVRTTRRKFIKGEVYDWQLKYLAEIQFESYASDPRSCSSRERIIDLLRQYKEKTGSIMVEDDENFPGLFAWRRRISRTMRKTPLKQWGKRVTYGQLRAEFPDVTEEEWRDFFLKLPSIRRLSKQKV